MTMDRNVTLCNDNDPVLNIWPKTNCFGDRIVQQLEFTFLAYMNGFNISKLGWNRPAIL